MIASCDLRGQHVRELGPHVLRARRRPCGALQPPEVALELLRDGLEVLLGEVLDVALEARLRPAPLVVPAGRLLGAVGELLQAPAPQRETLALLAADDGHERSLAAADERHERARAGSRPRPGSCRAPTPAAARCSRRCRGPPTKTASPCAPSRSNSSRSSAEALEVRLQALTHLVGEVAARRRRALRSRRRAASSRAWPTRAAVGAMLGSRSR